MSDIFHENENYIVTMGNFGNPVESHGGHYTHGYLVINTKTGVVEIETPQLPDAIAVAEQLDVALTQEPWKWMRAQQESASVNPDGSPVTTMPPEEIH